MFCKVLRQVAGAGAAVCRAVQQCDKRKKVTIAPDDIMEALKEAEFEDFQGPLQASLDAFQGAAKAAKTAKASSAKRQKLNESQNDENAEAGASSHHPWSSLVNLAAPPMPLTKCEVCTGEGDEETQEQNASQEVGEDAEGGNQETPVAGAVAKEEEEEEKTVATEATEGVDATQADA
jgi:hypothetical protein